MMIVLCRSVSVYCVLVSASIVHYSQSEIQVPAFVQVTRKNELSHSFVVSFCHVFAVNKVFLFDFDIALPNCVINLMLT